MGTFVAAVGTALANPAAQAALIAAGTAATIISQRRQGKAVEAAAKQQADQEKIAGRDREIQRRRRLIRALSSQAAGTAASGTGFTGSPAAIAQSDISQFQLDQITDAANIANRAESLRFSGRQARSRAFINSSASLIQGVERIGRI